MLRKIILTLLLFTCLPARSFELPADFSAEYQLVKMGTVIGKTTLRLSHEQGKIIYTTTTEPKGIISLVMHDNIEEKSILQPSTNEAQPRLTHYSYNKNKNNEKNQAIDITWHDASNAEILARYKNTNHKLRHSGPLWDHNSMQIALMAELKSNLNITQLNYNVVDKGEIDTYQYRHVADERRKVANKLYNAVKFSLQQPGNNRIIYMWLVPELDYLPVYIEQYKDNTLNLTMELVKHTAGKS